MENKGPCSSELAYRKRSATARFKGPGSLPALLTEKARGQGLAREAMEGQPSDVFLAVAQNQSDPILAQGSVNSPLHFRLPILVLGFCPVHWGPWPRRALPEAMGQSCQEEGGKFQRRGAFHATAGGGGGLGDRGDRRIRGGGCFLMDPSFALVGGGGGL